VFPVFDQQTVNREKFVSFEMLRALIVVALLGSAMQSFADDCAEAHGAMLKSGHTPHTVTITKSDAQGKKVVTQQVQTVTNKYVQTADGKWYAMNIAMKDLTDDFAGKMTCRSGGSDSVNGESTAVYQVHMDDEGSISDMKMWVSSKNLILKSEGVMEGAHYTTEYDYAHATPPANAVSMGAR
jgi:hypothetical protein